MSIQAVASHLRAAAGNDPGTLDPNRLLWIIEGRCRELNLSSPAAYASYLVETPSELDVLVEAVVVRETRFFRDPIVFQHIRQTLVRLAREVIGPLRILSAPCSTGEEAYSIAGLLQISGIAPERYKIEALDISAGSLEFARRGVYGERAFQQMPLELRAACAAPCGEEWRVHGALRERIEFARRNLAERDVLGASAQYHLILCRNLFIYLAPEARAALARSLATALLPEGRLFLGTADRVEELTAFFAPMRPASSFEFIHRHTNRAAGEVASTLSRSPRRRPAPLAPVRPERTSLAVDRGNSAAVETGQHAPHELLKQALEHRQRGEFAKAERQCRQALYLAPNLLPALELLQTLWSDHPNLRQRRALRDRVLRNRLLWSALDGNALKDNA